MSLVGFPAENHPQQVGRRAARDDVDDRGTHPIHFAEFAAEFGPFTLDVAAAAHNAKCDAYYDREQDGLAQPWHGVVWCNPPYSGLGAWLEKAWHEWQNTDVKRIVMLLPANRTEQRWWQDYEAMTENRCAVCGLRIRRAKEGDRPWLHDDPAYDPFKTPIHAPRPAATTVSDFLPAPSTTQGEQHG